jgi:galactokinase
MSGDPSGAAPPPAVARRAREVYREVFHARLGAHAPQPLALAWAPGRINLIGEHTDYSEGFALPAAIDRLVALAGRPADEPLATLYSAHHREWASLRLDDGADDDKQAEPTPFWARYVLATWRQLAQAGAAAPSRGFSAVICGDVPLGAGLSSSAALEVATAMFVHALGGPALRPMTMARLCQQAEQAGAAVRVGILDQAASCLGRPQHAILLDCRTLDAEYIAANLPEAAWVVFDTRVPHTLATSAYNVRREQCEAAVAALVPALHAETPGRHIQTLRDVTAVDLARHGALLDETLLRRARHVVSENERTLRAAEALRAGDAATLGALLNASHMSLRDDFAVSCPELDAAAEIIQATPGALGARMMGAGFGGSVLALVRRDGLGRVAARLADEYPHRTGGTGAMLECFIAGQPGVG